MEIKISYADALRIVEARDKAYADDIKALVLLLRKRPLDVWLGGIGDIPAECKSDYAAQLYKDQLIARAKGYIQAEFETYMKSTHPALIEE